ncbi:hypothetical protein NEUTE1DRAFT_114949 [Neurospora tetrasperma FGSC 2508]|uniref:Uncharacterized protein n=1 Tax=Neurospora tetrasperma (strain FGSC 2508 / ATCC MYA-4615 / P0657) TaxID=510951 RepID=F8N156_NEUT8|nr:uncharacterized protein NEUTE1DRAFT_114949 [Neurospora tetrasperma FGSC 2508]EGO53089.1 hypothetical protein NEUTE1DRAFT_114949 [Neurospora tetrasperma FGSC 2508]
MVDTLTLDATQRAATGTFHGGRRGVLEMLIRGPFFQFFPTSGPQFLEPAPLSPSFHTRPLSSLPHIPAITTSTLPPQVPPASVKSAVGISINIPSVGAREPATTGTKREPPKVVIKHPDTLQQSTNFVIMLAMCHCHFFAPYDSCLAHLASRIARGLRRLMLYSIRKVPSPGVPHIYLCAPMYSAAFHLHGNTVKRADSVEELLPSVPIGSSGIRVPLRDQPNAIVTNGNPPKTTGTRYM